MISLAGCVTTTDKDTRLFFPPPPEQARFMYEVELRRGSDIETKNVSQQLFDIARPAPPESTVFRKPMSVVAHGGRIYITDTKLPGVHVFDVARGRYFSFGYRENGRLYKPTGIALDQEGFVYVTDTKSRNVKVFDRLGLFAKVIGNEKDLERPIAVTVNPAGDRIYVVDNGGLKSIEHKVVVYDSEGKRLFKFGGRGFKDGKFNVPVAAAMDADGTVYILDAGNFRVQSFDPKGKFKFKFGGVGNSHGKFARPRGLAVDKDGNIYVSDSAFGNIQIFDPKGRLLLDIGKISLTDKPGTFGMIAGLAIDETERVYVVDQIFSRLSVIKRVRESGQKPTGGAKN